jgi:uncharacterized integral membrane protein (TIGR00697 family)
MNASTFNNKKHLLFLLLGLFFITHVFIAEFIGVKIFSLEKSLGFQKGVDWRILGFDSLSFNLTAGVLIWPVVFLMTDIINEYYGKRGVRLLSFWAAGLILYAFFIVYTSIKLSPSDYWVQSNQAKGIDDMNLAFSLVFGQGNWIIVGSLVAFLVGQFVDVFTFQWLRKLTGSKKIWLRATGSTLVSQLIDSFVVLFIAFYIGADWPLKFVLAIGLMNYLYKFFIALAVTPLLYLVHAFIDNYLGEELANEMKAEASQL